MDPEQQKVNLQSIYRELTKALQEELNELNKARREVTLFSGEFLGTFAEQYYYRFEIPEHIWLRNIVHVTFTFGKSDPVVMSSTIVTIDNQFLIVALPFDFGAVIPEIQCSWSYDEHLLPIVTLLSSDNSSAIASKLFGLDIASNNFISNIELQFSPDATEEHRVAAQKIVQNIVSFLWGSYGAGKTDVLTYLALNYLKVQKKVLFLTSTCEQADDVIQKIIAEGLRLGVDVPTETRRVGLPSFFNIDAARNVSFDAEIEAKRKQLQQKSSEQFKMFYSFSSSRIKQILFETHYVKIDELKEKVEEKKRQLFQVSGELSTSQDNVKRIQNASMLERMKKGFGKADLELAQKQYQEKLALQKRLLSIQQSMLSEIAKLEAQAPLTPEQLKEYESTLKRIQAHGGVEKVKQAVDEQSKINRTELLQAKKLLVTSLDVFLSDRSFESLQFDIVLVDNAERMNLADLAVVAQRAAGQLVVTGDPFLLEPESYAKTHLISRYLQQDIFSHLTGTNELTKLFDWSNSHQESSVFLLSPSSQSPHSVSVLLSKVFPDKFNSIGATKPRGRIFFVDTSYLHSSCRQYLGRKKILPFNDLQTKKVVECVKHAIMEPNRVAADVGVVLPAAGITLYTKLQLRLQGIHNVEVGTPQSLADRRKKAIIFDTAMAGADYTLRSLDDRKSGEQYVTRFLTTVLSCASEDVYILADVGHFQTRYKDRLITSLLGYLQSYSSSTSVFQQAAKKFDELEWNQRKPLYEFRRTVSTAAVIQEAPKAERTKEDIERELHAKMAAAQSAKPKITGRNYEMETYVAVHRILGWLTDINLLSQYIGEDAHFRHTLASEQAAARLPIDYCQNEKQFSDIMQRWDLLVYQMSGADKNDHNFFKQTAETRVRWDINALKVYHSADVEAVMEEGRKKLATTVGKIFQDCVGKPQPASPVEWSTAYLNFLTRMEKYLQWIAAEVRK